jgi:hypothetical protein
MEQYANWFAVAATIAAASITSANLGSRITGFGFVVFTVGSLAWLAYGIMSGQPSLIWTNAALTGLNLFGVWRWLGREARLEEGGKAAQQASAETPGETLFPVSLLGSAPLFGQDGVELGRAVDAMAGCDSGRLRYAVISAGGIGGVGETLRRVPWTNVSAGRDGLRTDLGPREFERLEQLAKDEWPGR